MKLVKEIILKEKKGDLVRAKIQVVEKTTTDYSVSVESAYGTDMTSVKDKMEAIALAYQKTLDFSMKYSLLSKEEK